MQFEYAVFEKYTCVSVSPSALWQVHRLPEVLHRFLSSFASKVHANLCQEDSCALLKTGSLLASGVSELAQG